MSIPIKTFLKMNNLQEIKGYIAKLNWNKLLDHSISINKHIINLEKELKKQSSGNAKFVADLPEDIEKLKRIRELQNAKIKKLRLFKSKNNRAKNTIKVWHEIAKTKGKKRKSRSKRKPRRSRKSHSKRKTRK